MIDDQLLFTPKISSISFHGVDFDLLRLDGLPTDFGGNKWYKLKYNLLKAKSEGHDTILTFGGPWSNHIHATAAACAHEGLNSIGVIRGEEPKELTATLQFAKSKGMKLHFVSRGEYREKNEDFFKAWLRSQHGRFYLIPEGGSNYLGVQGCTEILDDRTSNYDHIAVACGTGATAAGLILSMAAEQNLLAFSALKGDWMRDEIYTHLTYALGSEGEALNYADSFEVFPENRFGGFAKYNVELLEFMRDFYSHTGVQLDHLYTAKMVYQLVERLKSKPSKCLAVHTGGIQGLQGLRGLGV